MSDVKNECRLVVAAALNQFKTQKSISSDEILSETLQIVTPPNPEMGDLGIPMFPFAKSFKLAPPLIAKEVVSLILESKKLPINIFEDMHTIMTSDLCRYFKKSINQDDLIKLYASLISNNILTTIKWYHKNYLNFERNQIIQIVLQTVETGLEQSITAIMKGQK